MSKVPGANGRSSACAARKLTRSLTPVLSALARSNATMSSDGSTPDQPQIGAPAGQPVTMHASRVAGQ